MKRILYILIVTAVLMISPRESFCQLGYYWSHQYGVRSTLLGNSVIGSVVDLGAVYYNPARLAVIEKPAFLLSADVYEWTNLRIEGAFDEGQKVKKSNFGNAPGFAAGTFNIKFLPKHRFAYAIMGRERTSISLKYRQEVLRDVFPEVAGDELVGAGLAIDLDSRTRWYSVAWSYPINENLGIGVTLTGSQTSAKRTTDLDLQALAESGDVGVYRFSRRIDLSQDGILCKIGLAGRWYDKIDWGVTFTTPTLKVRGDGQYTYEEYLSDLQERSNEDIFTSSNQSGLNVRVRTPISVGIGLSFPIRKARLHFSSEWFNRMPRYVLMESIPHESQSSGDTIGLQLTDDLQHVVNFGIGLDYNIHEKVQLYASLNSDFSAVAGDVTSFVENEMNVSYSAWTADRWHYSAGASFQIKTAELTLGFSKTRARQSFARPIDFPDDDGEVGFTSDDPAILRWSRLQLVLGFSVSFGKFEVGNVK